MDYLQLAASLASLPGGGGDALTHLLSLCPSPLDEISILSQNIVVESTPQTEQQQLQSKNTQQRKLRRSLSINQQQALLAGFQYIATGVAGSGVDRVARLVPGWLRLLSTCALSKKQGAAARVEKTTTISSANTAEEEQQRFVQQIVSLAVEASYKHSIPNIIVTLSSILRSIALSNDLGQYLQQLQQQQQQVVVDSTVEATSNVMIKGVNSSGSKNISNAPVKAPRFYTFMCGCLSALSALNNDEYFEGPPPPASSSPSRTGSSRPPPRSVALHRASLVDAITHLLVAFGEPCMEVNGNHGSSNNNNGTSFANDTHYRIGRYLNNNNYNNSAATGLGRNSALHGQQQHGPKSINAAHASTFAPVSTHPEIAQLCALSLLAIRSLLPSQELRLSTSSSDQHVTGGASTTTTTTRNGGGKKIDETLGTRTQRAAAGVAASSSATFDSAGPHHTALLDNALVQSYTSLVSMVKTVEYIAENVLMTPNPGSNSNILFKNNRIGGNSGSSCASTTSDVSSDATQPPPPPPPTTTTTFDNNSTSEIGDMFSIVVFESEVLMKAAAIETLVRIAQCMPRNRVKIANMLTDVLKQALAGATQVSSSLASLEKQMSRVFQRSSSALENLNEQNNEADDDNVDDNDDDKDENNAQRHVAGNTALRLSILFRQQSALILLVQTAIAAVTTLSRYAQSPLFTTPPLQSQQQQQSSSSKASEAVAGTGAALVSSSSPISTFTGVIDARRATARTQKDSTTTSSSSLSGTAAAPFQLPSLPFSNHQGQRQLEFASSSDSSEMIGKSSSTDLHSLSSTIIVVDYSVLGAAMTVLRAALTAGTGFTATRKRFVRPTTSVAARLRGLKLGQQQLLKLKTTGGSTKGVVGNSLFAIDEDRRDTDTAPISSNSGKNISTSLRDVLIGGLCALMAVELGSQPHPTALPSSLFPISSERTPSDMSKVSQYYYRVPPTITEGSSTFDASTTVSLIYELKRELVACRDSSLSSSSSSTSSQPSIGFSSFVRGKQRMPTGTGTGENTGTATASDDGNTATAIGNYNNSSSYDYAQETLSAAAQALQRCVEITQLLYHIVSICDHPGVTALVVDAFVTAWVAEKELMNNSRGMHGEKKGIGLSFPKMQLPNLMMASSSSSSNTAAIANANAAATLSSSTPAASSDSSSSSQQQGSSSMFSRLFGGGGGGSNKESLPTTATISSGSSGAALPPPPPGVGTTQSGRRSQQQQQQQQQQLQVRARRRSIADPNDRSPLRRVLAASMVRTCLLRSASTGVYAMVAEALVARYTKATAYVLTAPSSSAASSATSTASAATSLAQTHILCSELGSALATLGQGLRSITAVVRAEARTAASDFSSSSAPRFIRTRLEAELAAIDSKRADARHRLLVLATQLGSEAYKRLSGSGSSVSEIASLAVAAAPFASSADPSLGALFSMPAISGAVPGSSSSSTTTAMGGFFGSLFGPLLPGLAQVLAAAPSIPSSINPTGSISHPLASNIVGGLNTTNHTKRLASVAAANGIPQRTAPASIRMYRSLWLALAAGRFTDVQLRLWPAAWYRAVRAIAVNTPVLIVRASTGTYFDGDLAASSGTRSSTAATSGNTGSGSFFSIGTSATSTSSVGTDAMLNESRNYLMSVLPEVRELLLALPSNQLVFVRSLYALETCRAASGTCKAALLYLHDASIEKEGLGQIAAAVASAAFRVFTARAQRMGRGEQRDDLLRDHALFFLARCVHRYPRVKNMGFRFLVDLVDRFPQLLWDEDVLKALLDTVEVLAQRARQGNEPPTNNDLGGKGNNNNNHNDNNSSSSNNKNTSMSLLPTKTLLMIDGVTVMSALNDHSTSDPYNESAALAIPSSPYSMHTPSSQAQLTDSLSDLTELTCQWLLRAVVAAPAETRSLFQSFLTRVAAASSSSALSTLQPHSGILAGLHGIASTASAASPPFIRPYGMASRVRQAGLALVGRSPNSLPAGLAQLGAAHIHVRWSGASGPTSGSGVGDGGSGLASSSGGGGGAGGPGGGNGVSGSAGGNAGNNPGSAAAHGGGVPPTGSSSSATAVGAAGNSGNVGGGSGSGGAALGSFAPSSAAGSLGGFYATSWAQVPVGKLFEQKHFGAQAVGRGFGGGSVIDEGDDDDDDESSSTGGHGRRGGGGDDSASVMTRSSAGRGQRGRGGVGGGGGGGGGSGSNQLPPSGPGTLSGGRISSSASVYGGGGTPQGVAAAAVASAAALGLTFGTATALVTYTYALDYGRSYLLHAPVDPLSLLSNQLAPSFASLADRRSHYLGQIEGMALFHSHHMAGTSSTAGVSTVSRGEEVEGSVASFEQVACRQLANVAGALLVASQADWRHELAVLVAGGASNGGAASSSSSSSDKLPIYRAHTLFEQDLLNDVIGVTPAEALPRFARLPHNNNYHHHHRARGRRHHSHDRAKKPRKEAGGTRIKRLKKGGIEIYDGGDSSDASKSSRSNSNSGTSRSSSSSSNANGVRENPKRSHEKQPQSAIAAAGVKSTNEAGEATSSVSKPATSVASNRSTFARVRDPIRSFLKQRSSSSGNNNAGAPVTTNLETADATAPIIPVAAKSPTTRGLGKLKNVFRSRSLSSKDVKDTSDAGVAAPTTTRTRLGVFGVLSKSRSSTSQPPSLPPVSAAARVATINKPRSSSVKRDQSSSAASNTVNRDKKERGRSSGAKKSKQGQNQNQKRTEMETKTRVKPSQANIDASLHRMTALLVWSYSRGYTAGTSESSSSSSSSSPNNNTSSRVFSELTDALLPLIVWLPVRIFTLASLSTATDCWTWLLASVPSLRVRLMSEIVEAWSWTCTMRMGLFSGTASVGVAESASSAATAVPQTSSSSTSTPTAAAPTSESSPASSMPDLLTPPFVPSPLSSNNNNPEKRSEDAEAALAGNITRAPVSRLPPGLYNVEPHRIWLGFFEERFHVARSKSGEEVALLISAATRSVADTTRLSVAPAAFGIRVRLLHLSMCLLHAAHYPDHVREWQSGMRWESGPILPSSVDSSGSLPNKSQSFSRGVSDGSTGSGRSFENSTNINNTPASILTLGGVGAWNGPLPGRDAAFERYAEHDDEDEYLYATPASSSSPPPRSRTLKDVATEMVLASEAKIWKGGSTTDPSMNDFTTTGSSASAFGLPDADGGGLLVGSGPWYLRPGSLQVVSRRAGIDEYGILSSATANQTIRPFRVGEGTVGALSPLGASSDVWPSIAAGSLAVFRERIFRASLAWFELLPTRYQTATSPERVRQDFPYIVSFCRLLQADSRFFFSSDINGGFTPGGSGRQLSTASVSASSSMAEYGMNSGSGVPPTPALLSRSASRVFTSATPSSPGYAGSRGNLPALASSSSFALSRGNSNAALPLGWGETATTSTRDMRRMVLGRLPASATFGSAASGSGSFVDLSAGGSCSSFSARASFYGSDGLLDMSRNESSPNIFRVKSRLMNVGDGGGGGGCGRGFGISPGAASSSSSRFGRSSLDGNNYYDAYGLLMSTTPFPGGLLSASSSSPHAYGSSRFGSSSSSSSSSDQNRSTNNEGQASPANDMLFVPLPTYSYVWGNSASSSAAASSTSLPIPPSSILRLGAFAGAAAAKNMRDLALVCMSHEIDRIISWYNPLDVEERRLPDEKEFSFDVLVSQSASFVAPATTTGSATPPASAAAAANAAASASAVAPPSAAALGRIEWNRHAATAWAINPHLAIRVWHRFGKPRELTYPLSQYVLMDPAAVRHDPDAVRLLVTQETLASNSPHLRHLLLWAPATMPTLLDLTARCSYSDDPTRPPGAPPLHHPLVAAYIVRCLRRFTPDTVVFYLPQIVQALRHDSAGQLADFLFTTSQTSMLVAHQLIWLLVSESKAGDEAEGKHGGASASGSSSSSSNASGGGAGSSLSNSGTGLSSSNTGGVLVGAALLQSSSADTTQAAAAASSMERIGISGAGIGISTAASHGFQHNLRGPDTLPARAVALMTRILATFPPTAKAMFELQYSFWDHITDISGRLKTEVAEKSQRRAKVKEFLKDLQQEAERDHYYARERIARAVKKELKQHLASPVGDQQQQPGGVAGYGAIDITVDSTGGGSSAASGGVAAATAATATTTGSSSGPLLVSAASKAAETSNTNITGGSGNTTTSATTTLSPSSNAGGKRSLPLAGALRVLGGDVAGAPRLQPSLGIVSSVGIEQHKNVSWAPGAADGAASNNVVHEASESSAGKSRGGGGGTLVVDRESFARAATEDSPHIIDEIYMPTNPYARVVSVDMDSGRPMQSAAKCPFLLTFTVEPYEGPDATLHRLERLEAKRKRDRLRLAAEAKLLYGSGKNKNSLRLRQTDDPMMRARLGAQHAALVVRRQVHEQRVQMGLTLVRTREQMTKELQRQRKEIEKGVNTMVAGMTKNMALLRTGMKSSALNNNNNNSSSSIPTATTSSGQPAAPASTLSLSQQQQQQSTAELEEDRARMTADENENNDEEEHGDRRFQNVVEGDFDDELSEASTADELAYAEADDARRGSDHDDDEENEEGDAEKKEKQKKEIQGGAAAISIDPATIAPSSSSIMAATSSISSTAPGDGTQKPRTKLRDRLGLSKLRTSLSRPKKLLAQEGDEQQDSTRRTSRRRLRASFRLGRKSNYKQRDEEEEENENMARERGGDRLNTLTPLPEDVMQAEEGTVGAIILPSSSAPMNFVENGHHSHHQHHHHHSRHHHKHGHSQSSYPSFKFSRSRTSKNNSDNTSSSSSSFLPVSMPAAGGSATTLSPALKRAAYTKMSCIFKVFDDCRQDALAIQVIHLFKEVFSAANIGLFLFPYRVIPTRTGTKKAPGGILECVPDVRSRDEIGKAGFPTLYDYFISTFGRPDGAEFEVARRNMIRSLSAYGIVCYLLRIKDRHNGNLLVTSKGHMVHIDFGFLLGISPGGNLGFETAAFKLTQEMVDIMGGTTDTEMFQYFLELTCRAFLLAREHAPVVHALVSGMADSGLPCFLFPDTLAKLWGRFHFEEGDIKACRFMREATLEAASSKTTVWYDGIQKLQNNIHSEAWQ